MAPVSGACVMGLSFMLACILAEAIDFEIGNFRYVRTSMTLTLNLNRVIWHTVV